MTDLGEQKGYYYFGKKHEKRNKFGEIDYDWSLKVDG